MGAISCFFACLVTFYWMSDIVNGSFWGTRYFYIPINNLELCSGTQKKLLGGILSFQGLLLSFIRQDQSSLQSNVAQLLKQNPSEYSSTARKVSLLWLVEVTRIQTRIQVNPLHGELLDFPPSPFVWLLPWLCIEFPYMNAMINSLSLQGGPVSRYL